MGWMTVGQLIEDLQQYDEDAEVRIAVQPEWPLQHHVAGVSDLEGKKIVWIGAGQQLNGLEENSPYCPSAVAENLW